MCMWVQALYAVCNASNEMVHHLETEKEMERDAKLRVESSELFEKQFKVILCEIEED